MLVFYLDYCLVLSFCNAMSSVSISKLVETKVSHQRSLSPTKSDTCKLFFKAKQSSSFYPDSFVCLLSVLFFFFSIPDQDFLMTEMCQRGMIAMMKHFKVLLWRPWQRQHSVVSTGHAAPIGSITSNNSILKCEAHTIFLKFH